MSYRIFHFMWCFFILIHHSLTAGAWSKVGDHFLGSGNFFFIALSIVMPVLLIVSLFKPHRPLLFAAALLAWTCIKFGNMPFIPNHIILACIVNLTIISAISYVIVQYPDQKIKKRVALIYRASAPAMRWLLIILYFFTVFHKINWDYLNPVVSCGVELYNDIRNSLSFLPQDNWVKWLTIVGTLVIELLIPALLIFPKSRMYGITIGLVFHFLLAIHPNLMIFSFTTEVYALYVLFLPRKVIDVLYRTVDHFFLQVLAINPKRKMNIAAVGAILLLGLLAFLILYFKPMPGVPPNYQQLIIFFLYCWCSFLIFMSVRYIFKNSESRENSPYFLKLPVPFLFIFPFLILLNGFTPYLGLKTATNFSMFSNLKVKGEESNHILIPKIYPLLTYGDHLLEILDSDYEPFQKINRNNEFITYFEFERLVQNYKSEKPACLIYTYRNRTAEVNLPADKNLPQFNQASWLEKKFIIFRNIPKEDPCPCQW